MKIASFLRGDNSLKPSQKRTREIFFYLFFGVLTTLVNLAAFIIFDKIFGARHAYVTLGSFRFDLLGYDVLNLTVAWIISVIFAFITNRTFVFVSKGPVFKEFIGFVTSRIVTLVAFEIGTFELCILFLQYGLGIDKNIVLFSLAGRTFTYLYVVKLLNSVLVVAGNYILSKIFVFRTKNSRGGSDTQRDGESDKNGEQ